MKTKIEDGGLRMEDGGDFHAQVFSILNPPSSILVLEIDHAS
jgi:hypothetical protein